MSEEASPQTIVAAPRQTNRLEALRLRLAGINVTAAIAIVAFLTGAAVMLAYSPTRQVAVGDSAIYDYMAQSIVRGQVPYRDVRESK